MANQAGDVTWHKWHEQNPWNQPYKQPWEPWENSNKKDYKDEMIKLLQEQLALLQQSQKDSLGILLIGDDGKLHIRLPNGDELLLESMDDIKKIMTKKLLKNQIAGALYHCKICDKDYTEPSLGGPEICPLCDCGSNKNLNEYFNCFVGNYESSI